MVDTGQQLSQAPATNQGDVVLGRSGWTGWIFFAGAIMILIGALHAILGFVALFKDEYYLVPKSGLVVHVDYSVWGWVQLAIGLLVVCGGFGAVTGKLWGRVLAVLFAMASAVVNMAFLAAYPLWSTLVIALDVIVIWALIVHGSELKDE